MSQIIDANLFTVSVIEIPEKNESNDQAQDDESPNKHDKPNLTDNLQILGEHTNMTSARVINGRVIELGHSNLAGPSVKFKTVINYERLLKPKSSLGVILRPQDGYLARAEYT